MKNLNESIIMFFIFISSFAFPFQYLYAESEAHKCKNSIKLEIEVFNDFFKREIEDLKVENFTNTKNEKKSNAKLKEEYCAYWKLESLVNYFDNKTIPVCFNAHFVSDDPLVDCHSIKSNYVRKAIMKWDSCRESRNPYYSGRHLDRKEGNPEDSNKDDCWNEQENWYGNIYDFKPLEGRGLVVNHISCWLPVKEEIKEKICIRCHEPFPKKWIICYQYFSPKEIVK